MTRGMDCTARQSSMHSGACRLSPQRPRRICAAESDLERFGAGLAELQRAIGDYFAPVQGGARYSSPIVAEVLAWLASEGIGAIGQSSWGPTGFAILASEGDAAPLLRSLERRWPEASGLRFALSRGRNHGGEIVAE